MHPQAGVAGGVSNIAIRKGVPTTCCEKGRERESQHLPLITPCYRLRTVPKKERDPLSYPYLLFHPQ